MRGSTFLLEPSSSDRRNAGKISIFFSPHFFLYARFLPSLSFCFSSLFSSFSFGLIPTNFFFFLLSLAIISFFFNFFFPFLILSFFPSFFLIYRILIPPPPPPPAGPLSYLAICLIPTFSLIFLSFFIIHLTLSSM